MLALDISPGGAYFVAARIREVRQCPCGFKWAVVQELPCSVRWRYGERVEMVIIRQGRSRTGRHWVELHDNDSVLSTGCYQEFVALGDFTLVPRELALYLLYDLYGNKGRILAVFRDHEPYFYHEVAVVGVPDMSRFPKVPLTRECGRCVRQRLRTQPDYVQGHLFIKKERQWVFPRAGVSVWSTADEEMVVDFFNHSIRFANGSLFVRRDMASLYLHKDGRAYISSPDHPGKDIYLGPGEYNLFHPCPHRRGVD